MPHKDRQTEQMIERLKQQITELRQQMREGLILDHLPAPLFPSDEHVLIGPGQRLVFGTPMGARLEIDGDGNLTCYDARNVPFLSARPTHAIRIGYLQETSAVPGHVELNETGVSIHAHDAVIDDELHVRDTDSNNDMVLTATADGWSISIWDRIADVITERLSVTDTMLEITVPTFRSVFWTGGPWGQWEIDWQIGSEVAWLRFPVPLQFAKASVGTSEEIIPYLGVVDTAPAPRPYGGNAYQNNHLVYVRILYAPSVARTFRVMSGTTVLKEIAGSAGEATWQASPDGDIPTVSFPAGGSVQLVAAAGDALTGISAIVGVS